MSNSLLIAVWCRTQPLTPVSHLSSGFGQNKITRAPSVELKEPLLFALLWIFDSNSGLSILQGGPIVRVDQAGFQTNRYLWKKKKRRKSSCRNHKDTKRNKQHCGFLFNKNLFKATVFISSQKKLHEYVNYTKKVTMRFTRLVMKAKRKTKLVWYEFRRYKGDNYGSSLQAHWLVSGLLSRLCWQNYLDSHRFYFHHLVLIGPARFNKPFLECSVSVSLTAEMSVSASALDWLTAYMDEGGEKDNV